MRSEEECCFRQGDLEGVLCEEGQILSRILTEVWELAKGYVEEENLS